MKKKDLEMRLQSLDGFKDPDPSLEQYPTPSVIASDILFMAYINGDIFERKVNDLGCGTGIFTIGSGLLGGDAEGFDISGSAIDIARNNAKDLEIDVKFTVSDISRVERKADTTIMNPPFGSQRKHADRPFLDKAVELSGTIYSVHMGNSLPFLEEYAGGVGKELCFHKTYKYNMQHTFSFHSKSTHSMDVVMVMIR